MRSSFTLNIAIGLVQIPVKGYSTHQTPKSDVQLNQLHEGCHCRIKYKKCCPTHGEVAADEIVKGYEYAKDQYVLVDPEEIKSDCKEIRIAQFYADELDARNFSGTSYYLKPDKGGEKSYNLLAEALSLPFSELSGEYTKCGYGTAVIQGRDRLVRLVSIEGRLCLQILRWDSEVRPASDIDTGDPGHSDEELALMCDLIDSHSEELETGHCPYQQRLKGLVAQKLGDADAVASPAPEPEAPVINLLDALKQSLARAS